MFTRSKKSSLLESATDRAIRDLVHHPVGSEEYVKTLDMVSRLHAMKNEDKPSRVSKDNMAIIGANLLGIFMIIKHEAVNVISSRAINLILTPRR